MYLFSCYYSIAEIALRTFDKQIILQEDSSKRNTRSTYILLKHIFTIKQLKKAILETLVSN